MIPLPLLELRKLATATRSTDYLHDEHEHSTRRVRRRLQPGIIQEIVRKYEAGAMTPALCAEFGLSKTSVLRLLREQGVDLRRRPLTDEQVAVAAEMYASGLPIATIAAHFDTSYNNVRQRLIKAGVRMRPRGGSHEGRFASSA